MVLPQGSIVAYTLGITQLDPIKYDLLFERFLNRNVFPCLILMWDFGFERAGRGVSIWLSRKYGKDCVVQDVTFGTLAARGVIRNVGRVLDMPLCSVSIPLRKMVPAKIPGGKSCYHRQGNRSKSRAEKRPMMSSRISVILSDMAKRLEGLPRHTSMHAAGVVISQKDKVSEHVPLSRGKDGIHCNPVHHDNLEELGLLKMDFLGLRTLTVISNAVKNVEKNHGISLNMHEIDYNDQKVLDSLGTGRTDGGIPAGKRWNEGLHERAEASQPWRM